MRNPPLNPPNPKLAATQPGGEPTPASTIPATSIPMLDLRAEFAEMESEVRAALDEVLVAQQFILGLQVGAFEQELAEYAGRRFGVGVASGTDALILGLRACGVGPGDEVIVPTFTFVATAGAVSALGARPVFADSEAETLNIDPGSVRVACHIAHQSHHRRASVRAGCGFGAADGDCQPAQCGTHRG